VGPFQRPAGGGLARGDQLSRQWKLLRLLEHPSGRTVEELSTELGVTTRTVRRDLYAVDYAGWPVTSVPEDGRVRWRFVDGFKASTHLPLTLPVAVRRRFRPPRWTTAPVTAS